MYYEPKHFAVQELVTPEIFDIFGNGALTLFDINALKMIDGIREFFGKPITINNWHTGGNFSLRGLRPDNVGVGAKFSQHKFGRAFDMDIEGYTADNARRIIIEHHTSPSFQYISAMEKDVNWLHVDVRNINHNGIFIFNA